jgi:transposase
MKPPLYVRPLTDAERDDLKAKLRSSDAFTLRRSQILLASARGKRPREIAEELGCASQTVRNALRAFNERGLAALEEGSHCNLTSTAIFDAPRRERLQALAHRRPREFGHPTSVWTLTLLGQESARQGITPRPVSKETVRQAILQLGSSWKRAKRWITSPDPGYERKKGGATD